MMKPLFAYSLAHSLAGAAALALLGAVASLAAPSDAAPDAPRYDADGRLIPPSDYREWVFLSSGLNMSYNPAPETAGMDMFGNTFAPRAAYAAFKATGHWPDKTVLVLENRAGTTKGSINKHGQFQSGEAMGFEAHVKDEARFKGGAGGGWAFFAFDGDKPAKQIPYEAACYSCHQQHAAVDTTFVQFYPTLLPIAQKQKTLSAEYLVEQGKHAPVSAP